MPEPQTRPPGQRDEAASKLEVPRGVKLLRTLAGHQDAVMSVAFDPLGGTMASASADRTVRLWCARSGRLLRTLIGHQQAVRSVAYPPQGGMVASGSDDKTAKLWDVQSGHLLRSFEGRSCLVQCVAFDPQGRTMASGSRDHAVRLWDLRSGKLLHTLDGHRHGVLSVAFHPQGGTLACGGTDDRVYHWEVGSGRCLRMLAHWYRRVVIDLPDEVLAKEGADGRLFFRRPGTNELLEFVGQQGMLFSLAFDPAGETLASAHLDHTVKLWNARSGNLLGELNGHTSIIQCIAFSPDGRMLASKSCDGTIRLWDCKTWETVAVIPEPTGKSRYGGLAFHPTLPLLAASGTESGSPEKEYSRLIHIWELDFDALLGPAPVQGENASGGSRL